jgi:cell division protein FtsB
MNAEQRKLRNLAIILLVALVGLQIALWFSSTGVRNVQELKQNVENQESQNINLEQRNRTLEAEVSDLKTGLESVEERARSELGMIAEDETFFQLIEEDNSDETSLKLNNVTPQVAP